MVKSVWDDLEEVQVKQDDYIKPINNNQPKKSGSVWEDLEEIDSGTPVNDDEPIFNDNPLTFSEEHPLLYGGVKKVQQAANDFGGALNAPVTNPNVMQGLGNVARDLGRFGVGLVNGIPQFVGDIKNQAVETGTNIQNNPSAAGSIIPALGHGVDKALGDIVSGALNLPEAVAASYKGREYKPHFQSTAPIEFYADATTQALYNKGLISQEQYTDYLKHKEIAKQEQSQVPLAGTVGEFIPAMIPVGKAAGLLGGAGKTAGTLSKAQKITKVASDIAKGAGVGAGYGFVANPEANLAQRAESAGSGFAAGGALGAGGKLLQAGGKAAAPYVAKGVAKGAFEAGKAARVISDAAEEVGNRLNPKNYETVIDSVPVEKGMGLSQKTVYEGKTRRIYRNPKNVERNITPQEAPKLGKKGTDFTMGESSELQYKAPKTYAKQQLQKLLPFKENGASESGVAASSVSKIAPNTAEKQSTGNHTHAFNKGEIVKDIYTGEVFEVVEPDKNGMGHLRNVDDDVVSTINAHNNARYIKYAPTQSEFIEKTEFSYNPKAKPYANQENYVLSKQEYVDAYNEYVKNPTIENKEVYQDVYGKLQEEYNSKKAEFEKSSTLNKIAPKTLEKQIAQDNKVQEPTVQEDAVSQNAEVEELAREYSQMLGQSEIRDFHRNFANALINKKADTLKQLIAQGRGMNENSKKMFTKYTGIKLPTTIKGKAETIDKWANGELESTTIEKPTNNGNPTLKYNKDTKVYLENEKYHTDGNAAFLNEFVNKDNSKVKNPQPLESYNLNAIEEMFSQAAEAQTKLEDIGKIATTKYYGKIRVFEYNADGNSRKVYVQDRYLLNKKDIELYATGNKYRALSIRKNGEQIGIVMPIMINGEPALIDVPKMKQTLEKAQNRVYNKDIGGSYESTTTDAGRQNLSRKYEATESGTRKRTEEQSRVSEVLSRDGQQELRQSDLSERRIDTKDAEIVNAAYKNQHELNKAIEKYINDGEYKKYRSAAEIPAAVKEWLKKYAGAGGLEKQGAEGKGLLSEYYTPNNIVKKMWDITSQYVNTDGAKVLEPSVGIGRFLEHAPKNTSFDVVEMNPVSARITKLLYPDADVTTGEFQEKFIDKTKNMPVKNVIPEYDIVIGNPPYGTYSGKYKGLGEGKNFARMESYFISRGLDSLKENGIMTFIVPSSFLDGAITIGKQEIGKKCELVDAYRLPEKTFDTTSIGTDIIVLRKKTGSKESNINIGKWFKEHPEKILGTVENRKNRFGKMENYVKGEKNAVENIDTSKKDVKETIVANDVATVKSAAKNIQSSNSVKKVKTKDIKGNVEYTEYVPENKVSERERELWENTRVDGSLPEAFKAGKDINQYDGKLYNDFNYLQGDIYEKLEQLERENISPEQKEIQRQKLEKVLPKKKKASEIRFNPTSDFIQEFELNKAEETRWGKKVSPIVRGFIDYIDQIPSADWRDDYSSRNIESFLKGERVKFNINFDSKSPEYAREKSKKMSKLKSLVEKYFSNYVDKVLDKETSERLVNAWNRNFNNIYNPDYKKMPLLIKGLNSQFKGKKLELKTTQIEGVNFLTNKGVGLLGFEVGVGKTLTGIIATVQNMQMGRCKRPLIIIPKNIKKNWKEEFAETFPNLKVVDVDNMSKWDGKVEDGTITLATYQALDNIWYNKSDSQLTDMIYEAGNNFNKEVTKRGAENVKSRFEKMIGKALKGNKAKYNFEDLGFDHITFDEAHAGKNLFDEARADSTEMSADGKSMGNNAYFNMRGGRQSKVALRMFLMTQHVLNANNNRNVFMLTATPFNNQSLEVFNMLSYLAKDKLDKMGLYNVYQFNEHYIDVTSDIVLDANNNPVEKQVELGFKNADTLREIIRSCMLIRTAEDAEVIRPAKSVTRQKLDATEEQLYWFDQADEIAMNKEIDGALFKSLSLRRNATISPDVAANNVDVTPENFIKNSPKLDYIMKCIESMKNKDAKTSQLIYMPIGVKFLGKIKQYLVDKGVYKPNEIEIISSENALSNPEKEEARISKITDSFNDREGDVKLIIGTQKIQVGMNLNKNTSTLYMPYVEWNPTDFVQTVGRMWRQGNSYKNVRVVVPLLKNSADSFMFQKLDEKIKRMNDLMGSDKEYISNDDLQTEEEKIAMISNPAKRAKMYTLLQKDKINFEIKKLEAREKVAQQYKDNLQRAKNNIEYYEKEIKELEAKKQETGELAPYLSERLKDYKKSLLYNKKSIDSINVQIEMNNIDFNGKDSAEIIQQKIEALNKDIEELDNIEKQKLEEYSAEYDEERRNIKSIDEHIKEFEKEYDTLYNSESSEDFDVPFVSNVVNRISDYSAVRKAIKSGKKIGELLETEKIFDAFRDDLSDLKDYVITNMPDRIKTPSLQGLHQGSQKAIFLNMDAIGDNVEQFAKTLMHEVKHAKQRQEYEVAQAKKVKTKTDNIIIENYKNCEKANKNKRDYYNKHKKVIDTIKYDLKNLNQNEIRDYFKTLRPIEYKIFNEYKKLYNEYWNATNEIAAREAGADAAERISNANRQTSGRTNERQLRSDFGLEKRNSGTGRGYSNQNNPRRSPETFSRKTSPYGEAEEEEVIFNEDAIREKAEDKIYKWHGNIGKDRFDVDKHLNSFINTSKSIANEYSKKLGFKVSDKMVREILPFLRERTQLPEKLNRPELSKLFNSLSGIEKARLTKFADDTSNKFDKYYKDYQAAKGVEDAEGIENHISHIWDLDKKHKALLTNYFSTSSRFAKERTISTLVRGIDGFEVDGELIQFKPKTLDYAEILKTSSDNLIKATHDMILADEIKNLKYKGKNLVMATSKAPSDWIEINHPALNKVVYAGTTQNDNLIFRKGTVKVHPVVADKIKAIFEVQKPDNAAWKLYDNINGILKQSTLGFSGFHGYALSESAASNVGIKNTIKSMNFKKIYNSVAKGDYEIFKREEIVKRAMEDGLQIGTPSDLNRNQVEEFIGKIPVVGNFLQSVVSANNKVLWDCLHTIYKIDAYDYLVQSEGGYEHTTKQQRRAIAQWVNDSFGGQAWELLGVKKSTIKAASRILLSPDWNFSTIRQTMGLFDSKKGNAFLSSKDNDFWKTVKKVSEMLGASESVGSNGTRGKSAKAFFLRFMIYSAIGYNLINAAFREKDRKEHPELYPKNMSPIDYSIWGNISPNDKFFDKIFPYVFIGRNSDGSARYLRVGKQVREVPEMLSDPINKFGGKSSSLINLICQSALGISPADIPKKLTGNDENIYYNQNTWNGYGRFAKRKEGLELYGGMAKTALNSAMPFIVNKALDEKHEMSAWDMFAQTSKGTTYGKAIRQYKAAYQQGNEKDIAKITRKAYQDGVSKEKIEAAKKKALSSYRADNTSKYKHKYIEAMENKDKKEIQRITNTMRKNHLSAAEQRRIYEKAYKEYKGGK